MKKFDVKLHGENFLFSQDGEPGRFGFYARCIVKAKNPQEAEKRAIILTHQNPVLRESLVAEGNAHQAIHLVRVRKSNILKSLLKKEKMRIDFFPEDED